MAGHAVRGEAGELDQWRLTLQRHVGGGFGYAVENILTDSGRVTGGLGRERKRGQAFADRRELGQGGGIEYRIGDDHHVSGTGAHHGLTPGDVVHGACDALNGHQIAGLDYAAQHQAEAADDVGDCILQTQRDRHTSNTKGGDKCGRIDAEYGLQYHRCAGDPDGHAREVHENRGAGNLRIVQNLAQHAADDAVGHKYDGQYNGQPDEFAGVHLKPACDVFYIFSHTPTVSVVSGEVVETGWQKAESAYGRFRYSWCSRQVWPRPRASRIGSRISSNCSAGRSVRSPATSRTVRPVCTASAAMSAACS